MNKYFNIAIWEYDFYKPQVLWTILLIPILILIWNRVKKIRTGQLKFANSDQEQLAFSLGWVRYIRWGIDGLYTL